MTQKRLIGIDPGLNGAIASITWGDGLGKRIIGIRDMPTLEVNKEGRKKNRELNYTALADIIEGMSPPGSIALVELVNAMPGQGTASMFKFGKVYGAILATLATLEIPYMQVTPPKWKKALSVPQGKDAARVRASELLPAAAHHWPLVKHDGRAEAALIAYYGTITPLAVGRTEQ